MNLATLKLVRAVVSALIPVAIVAAFAFECAWIDGYGNALPASAWFRVPFIFAFLYAALCAPAVAFITAGTWFLDKIEGEQR